MTRERPWKAIGYVEVIFYAITAMVLLLLFLFNRARYSRKNLNRVSIAYTSIFNIIKIAGGITMLVELYSKFSEGLVIASYILNMASLGLLIKALLPMSLWENWYGKSSFNEKISKADLEIKEYTSYNDDARRDKSEHFLKTLLNVLLSAATAITIAAGSTITTVPHVASTLYKIGSFLFLATILIMIFLKVLKLHSWRAQPVFNTLIIVGCVLLLVRTCYNIVSAFEGVSLDEQHAHKSTFMFGEYTYYCFMAFLEECLVILILIGLNFIHAKEMTMMT